MKFIMLILVMWSLSLDASEYIRSIRLCSFNNKAAAKVTLDEATKFLYSHKEFKELAKTYQYRFKVTESSGYYLVVLEPITDKNTVQKLLDILRQKYTSAYPRKLHSMPKQNIEHLFDGYANKTAAIEEVNNTKEDEPKTVEIDTTPRVIKETPILEKPEHVEEIVQKKVVPEEKSAPVVEPKKAIKQVGPKALSGFAKFISIVAKNSITMLVILTVVIFLLLIMIILLKKSNNFLKNKNEMMLFDVSNKRRKLREKEKLLAHVIHELRNPIATVLSLSQLILENDLPAFQKENVHNIEDSSQKALELINDILNVSKVDAADIKIEYVEFSINNMVEHVLSSIYLQAKHNNVDVVLDIDDSVPSKIIGDSLRLGQVLINLLSNAVKFSPNGDVTLKVARKETYTQSILLEFTIIDNGIGMSSQELENILKPIQNLMPHQLKSLALAELV